MKQALIFGAGNIGRGFIGQLFARSGYALSFVDIDESLVAELNRRGEYPVRLLLGQGFSEEAIRNVRAMHARELDKITQAVAQADIIATAVGAGALPHAAKSLKAGLAGREKPVDIILCENMLDADTYMRELASASESVGLVRASVGRMVPLQTQEMQDGDALRICAEAYAQLPVDAAAFRAGIPAIEGLLPAAPFAFYMERKLYVHNMGHAAAAYLGFLRGYKYIWEAITDPAICIAVQDAMAESAAALCKKYGHDAQEAHAYIQDLLRRFGNRQLGDTIERVGRDLPRKLAECDRLFGAAILCEEQGVSNQNIRRGIGAALLFEEGGKVVALQQLRCMRDALMESSCK